MAFCRSGVPFASNRAFRRIEIHLLTGMASMLVPFGNHILTFILLVLLFAAS
jgi:hypothetical protein